MRTGEVFHDGKRLSIEEAVENRLITSELAIALQSHLDAAQRELSEAENGFKSTEKLIKVTTATAEITSPVKTIADAIKDGTVDPIQGVYKLPDSSTITITDAYQRGLLIRNEIVKIKSVPLCLADAILHGLVDQAGWVIDRNEGSKFRLDSAIANALILPHLQEVVDTRNDLKVSVTKAIEMGLLNAKTGRYVNPQTKEKLTFVEAKNRQLIVRPMTLKDACDLNLMTHEGFIVAPPRNKQLTIREAILAGVLDGDEISSISRGDDNGLLTLNEAINQGIVGVNNNFKNITTGEMMTVHDAVNEGLILSVTQKSLFDIDGFRNPLSGDFVSFNNALENEILVKTDEGFKLYVGDDKLVSIDEGVEKEIVRPEVSEMFSRSVGVFDESNSELSVMDLVLFDLIDPVSGYLLDYDRKTAVPLNHAIERNMISPEGALLLSSLLNITLTTESIIKVEKRYITIAKTLVSDYSKDESQDRDSGFGLADAIDQKVFDPSTGVFTIPNTDRLVNFEECIQLGLINHQSLKIVDPKYKEEISVHRAFEKNILDTTGHYRSELGWVPMDKGIEDGLIILTEPPPSAPSLNVLDFSRTTASSPDISSPDPVEIGPGLIYDPSTNLVINMKTGKSENLLKAVKDNTVPSEMLQLVDHSTGENISFEDAVKKGMVSPSTGEVTDHMGRKISLIDAVKTGLLVVAGVPLVAAAGAINSLKMIYDPKTNQHIPAELAYERGLVSRDEISDFTLSDAVPRSTVISQASSFDIPTPKDMALTPSKSQRHSCSYESEDSFLSDFKPSPVLRKGIIEPVDFDNSEFTRQGDQGLDTVDKSIHQLHLPPSVSNIDSSERVSINEALQRGLLDLKSGTYTDPSTNKVIEIQEAIQKGHLVSTGDHVEEEIFNLSPIHERSKEASKSSDVPSDKVKLDVEPSSQSIQESKAYKSISNVLHIDQFRNLPEQLPATKTQSSDIPVITDEKQLENKLAELSQLSSKLGKKVESQKDKIEAHAAPRVETQKTSESHESISNVLQIDQFLKSPEEPSETQTVEKPHQIKSTLKPQITQLPDDLKDQVKPSQVENLKSDKPSLSTKLKSEDPNIPNSEIESHEKPTNLLSSDMPKNILEYQPEDQSSLKELETAHQKSEVTESAKSQSSPLEPNKITQTSAPIAILRETPEVSHSQVEASSEKSKSGNASDMVKLGLMAIVGAPVLAGMAIADSVKSALNKSSDETKDVQEPSQNIFAKPPYGQDKMVCSTIAELSESMAESYKVEPENLEMNEKTTAEDLEKLGAFDKRAGAFIDPTTGTKVSFDDFVYNCDIFDPELIFVKDFSADNFIPLAVALEKVLIDRNTGIMVEPKTGKRVPFFECLKRQWIIQKEAPKVQTLSLNEARQSGLINEDSGKMAVDGMLLPINEALNSGNLEIDSISIRTSSGEIMPLSHAIESNIVDLKLGVIVDPKTGETTSLDSAFRSGNLLEGIMTPISLEAAINSGLYDKESQRIKFQNKLLSVQEAVTDGCIDPNISEVKHTQLNEFIPLQKAIDDKLIEDNLLKNTQTNELLPLHEALEQKLISTKPIKMTLISTIVKGFYKPESQLVLNPMTGQQQTIEDGINCGFVDIATTLIVDEKHESVLPAIKAIESGLLDAVSGCLTHPEMNLLGAYERGYILSSKKPISLSDAILRNIYDEKTGMFKLNECEMRLDECILAGEISSSDLIVHDSKSNEIISVNEAIKSGLLNAKHGFVNEPQTGEQLNFNEAVERGIIILSRRQCSLPEAVFKGLYDPQSGTFANTTTTEKLSTERAIKRGFIDPQSTIVNIGGKIFPFELSVENGTVDSKRGTITDEYGNKIDFREAFDRGILVEVRKPIGLYEALVKGIYCEETGLFMDPKTGKNLTLEQAIREKLIDPNSVQIKNPLIGSYKDISLLDAIRTGVIDDKANVRVDSRNLTMKQAFDLGILCDKKAPISIQRALHQGIYHSQSGKIVDPNTGKKITLHEAMRNWIINPQLPCYFNENEECLLSLLECCRSKMIDRREGVFKEPGSNVFVPLNEAMGMGLIVDIESGGFGLYEMLAMKLHDVEKGSFINPANGRMVTMADAIDDDLISVISSIVKDASNGAYLKLNEAIDAKRIDVVDGKYVYPDGRRIDLQEARKLGLIVSQQKLMPLEKALKMGLYRPENGMFVDPSTNQEINLQTCIDGGLIDGETTVLKNFLTGQDESIKDAIESGKINVANGRVIDPESKVWNNFDVAFSKGLLLTVQKPLADESVKRSENFDSILQSEIVKPLASKEMSLEEAIKQRIINAESALVKDPKTGQLRSLSKALEDQNIDLTKTISIDPTSLVFAFDPSCVVYARAPKTFENAVESGLLNLSDGTFNDPEHNVHCNLKEAITMGVIDPESALIKDSAKGKMIRLPEAFRKGLIDSDKFNVVDTSNSKLLSLKTAVDDAILVTPKRSLDLLEALEYNLYDSATGSIKDPFTSSNLPLTLQDAITKGLIDPSTTVVRDLNNSNIAPLQAAINSGLVDAVNGRVANDKDPIDFLKARDRLLLLPAEQRVSFWLTKSFIFCHLSVSCAIANEFLFHAIHNFMSAEGFKLYFCML